MAVIKSHAAPLRRTKRNWIPYCFVAPPLLLSIMSNFETVIDSLRMTRGTQGTNVLANLMYIQAFNNYQLGLGAATAVVLFFLSFVFIVLYLWRVMQDELEY
jgi:ABC-type sugar transport system permease subunit